MATTQINGATQIQAASIANAQIASAAAIASSKLADGANFLKKDGSVAMTAAFNAGSFVVSNVATPVAATDAANKGYVDAAIQGFTQKPTARVATTAVLAACTYANGASGVGATLTGNANNTQPSIDGVTLAVGDVILVKNQASALQNGLYTVTQLPTVSVPFVFTRHIDMDTALEFDGAFVPIDDEGTTNKNTVWLANNAGVFVVGTTAVTFTQLNGATVYTATLPVVVTGLVISINLGNGLGTSGSNAVVVLQDASLEFSGGQVRVTHGTAGQVYLANASGVCTATTLSGDVSSVSGTGAVTMDVTKVQTFARFANRETPTPATDGATTAFTIAHTPVSGVEALFKNGLEQDAGAGNDYTISGTTVTMLSAPAATDKLRVSYWW